MSMLGSQGITDSLGDRTQPAVHRWPVVPLILIVDLSNSMNRHGRLAALRATLERAVHQLHEIGEIRRGGELAIIGFGGAGVRALSLEGRPLDSASPIFTGLDDVDIANLELVAGGHTPLEAALNYAMDLAELRLEQLSGRERMRPNLILLTDGAPTDESRGLPVEIGSATIARLRRMEAARRGLIFAAGFAAADMDTLRSVAPASTYDYRNVDFVAAIELVLLSSQTVCTVDGTASAADIYGRIRAASEGVR
jgi:uncharacterized protein YegL